MVTARRSRARDIRRYVLGQVPSVRSLEARRTGFSATLAISARIRGKVRQSGTVVPGQGTYESCLRDRSADTSDLDVIGGEYRRVGTPTTRIPGLEDKQTCGSSSGAQLDYKNSDVQANDQGIAYPGDRGGCAISRHDQYASACAWIPDPHRAVAAAAGQQVAAVDGDRAHRVDPVLVGFQDSVLLTGGRVPDPHRAVGAGSARGRFPVGARGPDTRRGAVIPGIAWLRFQIRGWASPRSWAATGSLLPGKPHEARQNATRI